MLGFLDTLTAGLRPETRGALGVVVAMLFFSMMDATAKGLSATQPALQVVWARYTGQTLLLMLLLAPRLRTAFRTANLRVQALRSVFLFGATMLFFTSLQFLELAAAVSLLQTAPLFITALAAFLLAEPVGPRRWLGVALGLAGALIILRPGLSVFQPAALLALAAAVSLAAYQIATRMMGNLDSIWTTMLYTTLLGTLFASLALPFAWVTPAPGEIAPMLVMGAFGIVGHFALVWALGQAPASQLAPFNYTGIVWATLFGFLVFAELPDALSLFGTAVIVGAGLYVWHRERVRSRAP